MIEITEKKFTSWNDLTSFIDTHFSYFKAYSFRGHAETDWKLESTLTRVLRRIGIENDAPIIRNHITSFKHNLRGKSKFNLIDISENELLAIGQHFGLYTPLLDFTDSPYVGLFFALQGNSKSGLRCLWAISHSILEELSNVNENFESIIKVVRPLSNDNPRLVSQQGLFIKLPVNLSFEEIISEFVTKIKGKSVYKLIFNDEIREDSLASLNIMNINNLTLFPDYIGSSLHTNYLLEIEPYLQKKRREIWKDFEDKNLKTN